MRRDMSLIRLLMLTLEGMQRIDGIFQQLEAGQGELAIEGYGEDEIAYHLQLIEESGLIVTKGALLSGEILFDRLTWTGHDFVDSVRDPVIWEKTKKGAEAAGGFSLDLLRDLAKGFIRKQVEELTGVKV